MKNTFYILLITILIIFASCAGLSGVKQISQNITGNWKFDSVTTKSNSNNSELSTIFKESTLILLNDNTFSIKVSSFDRTGEWSLGKGGKLLILAFDDTKNTNKRLKTFSIVSNTAEILIIKYEEEADEIVITFKKTE